MTLIMDTAQWADKQFGHAELGDKRRTKRLVKITTDIANHAGKSLVKASKDDASIEGAYRFIRNDYVCADDIAKAGFVATEQEVKKKKLVLSLEDTTGLSFRHSVCNELGDVSSAKKDKVNAKGRTIFYHTSLMLDAQTENVIGLAGQQHWHRIEKVEKSEKAQRRDINEKESFKWQKTTEELDKQFGNTDNVIHVCDRESDIYEYMDHQLSNEHRFIVRANHDRKLINLDSRLHSVSEKLTPQAYYTVSVPQRGSRKAREAKIALSYCEGSIDSPKRVSGSKTLTFNIVICQEIGDENQDEKLCWYLYTNERIENAEHARQLVRYYELRWRIEEFHKVWKSDGTQVEKLRMQTKGNMERMTVILAFVAVLLMQLKELAQNQEEAKRRSCDECFNQKEWKLLWLKTEKKTLPGETPSLYWAYYALAKLGRWYDSKRTGKVGTKAIWSGWQELMVMLDAVEIAKNLPTDD
jgi:hypothetical protein